MENKEYIIGIPIEMFKDQNKNISHDYKKEINASIMAEIVFQGPCSYLRKLSTGHLYGTASKNSSEDL